MRRALLEFQRANCRSFLRRNPPILGDHVIVDRIKELDQIPAPLPNYQNQQVQRSSILDEGLALADHEEFNRFSERLAEMKASFSYARNELLGLKQIMNTRLGKTEEPLIVGEHVDGLFQEDKYVGGLIQEDVIKKDAPKTLAEDESDGGLIEEAVIKKDAGKPPIQDEHIDGLIPKNVIEKGEEAPEMKENKEDILNFSVSKIKQADLDQQKQELNMEYQEIKTRFCEVKQKFMKAYLEEIKQQVGHSTPLISERHLDQSEMLVIEKKMHHLTSEIYTFGQTLNMNVLKKTCSSDSKLISEALPALFSEIAKLLKKENIEMTTTINEFEIKFLKAMEEIQKGKAPAK